MGRLIRALWNKIMGMFGGISEKIEEDPDVIAATYDASIAQNTVSLATTKQAVAKLMGIEENRKTRLNTITEQIKTLTERRDGAAVVMKSISLQMQAQGATPEQIKTNAEILEAYRAHADLAAELARKVKDSQGLQSSLQSLQADVARMKTNLQSMKRGADSLRERKERAIVTVTSAKEEMAVRALASGESQRGTDQALQRAEQAVQNISNRAKLSAELEGVEQGASGEQYEKYANQAAAASEFEALLGLETKQPVTSEKLVPAQLPDS